MYRALLFDLDGTLTPVRSVWQHLHERLGLWDAHAVRHQEAFLRGRLTYEEFCRRDAAHWKGMPVARLRAFTDRIPYRRGARAAIAAARGRGAVVGVISTGLTLLADRAHRELGLDWSVANHLAVRGGRFSGAVAIRVRHGAKDAAVDRFCRRFRLDPAEVISIGDSDGDISMFARTGLSVAFQPATRRTARAASWVDRGASLLDLVRRLPLGGEGSLPAARRPARRATA
ncbi:MAG TPA: HAD-IB family phosphatase [Dongiaceae bacterium]|nr:HAD-IB family phosphatase [Dongiaceae bacterium]